MREPDRFERGDGAGSLLSRKEAALDPALKPNYLYRVALDRVVDGDTVDLWVDLGFRVHTHQRFRLAGINAPEVRGAEKAAGRESADWLARQLRVAMADKVPIFVESKKTGKYGRWLAVIWIEGVNINEKMVERGLAEHKEY